MDERLQRLQNSAVKGDVDALFSILEEDPLVLERIEKMSFVTTPLHAAVSGGNIHFVKEILNLKPSFVGKRDHLGLGLLHLALEGKHQELVTWLIKIHPELVRVKAKGMVTPLHYAAQLDDETNLADFLYVCPSSIEDLTVKSETAIHVAIKNWSFKAFKVLIGWLRHFAKEEILEWEDEEGNNALHTATSENRPEVVKLLIKCMDVNGVNGKGLTALEIFNDRQHLLHTEVGKILHAAKAKRASQLNRLLNFTTILTDNYLHYKNSFVNYLCGELNLLEVILKRARLGNRIINRIPLEVQNVVLVVAILIATATYQAALSPPGGNWQDEVEVARNNTSVINNTSAVSFSSPLEDHFFFRGRSHQHAGHMILGSPSHFCFLIFNTLAFSTSVSTITVVISGLPFCKIIVVTTGLVVFAYCLAVIETSPYPAGSVLGYLLYFLVTLFGLVPYYIPLALHIQERIMHIFYRRGQLRRGSFEQPKM